MVKKSKKSPKKITGTSKRKSPTSSKKPATAKKKGTSPLSRRSSAPRKRAASPKAKKKGKMETKTSSTPVKRPKGSEPVEHDLSKATITKWFDEGNLCQIYSSGLEYAFVNDEGVQCHPFAYCKDYLQDAIWATLHKSKVHIHGFQFDYSKNPKLDMKRMRMGLRLRKNTKFKEMCEKSLKFMRELDKDMGFAPCELAYGGKYKGGSDDVFVFYSDPQWFYNPILISFYTLALRVGMTYEGGPWREHFENAKSYLGRNDNAYTDAAKKVLDKIVGKKPADIFAADFASNYPKDIPTSSLHHRSGVVSFGQGNLDNKVKRPNS